MPDGGYALAERGHPEGRALAGRRRRSDARSSPSRAASAATRTTPRCCGPRRSSCAPGDELELWEGLSDVPPYDQDDDVEPAPAAVAALRAAVAEADAVLIATPEYNSSIPGALKNALDWASRPFATNAFRGKPVAVIGASAACSAPCGRRRSSARCSPRWVPASSRSRSPSATRGEKIDDERLSSTDEDAARTRSSRDALCDPRRAEARAGLASRLERPRLGLGGGSSSASRRCTTERDEHADELAAFDDRDALEVLLLEERERLGERHRPSRSSRSAPRRSRGAASSAGRGRRATTSRTSVLRVITPTSRPSSQHEHGAHLGPHQRLARLLRRRARRRATAARAPSRRGTQLPPLDAHGYIPRASSAADDLADAGDERRVAQRQPVARSESAQTRSNASPSFSASRAADLVAVPEQPAEVLHPLEVRDGDAAGVREHVRQHRDAARRRGSRRPSTDVGPFAPSATRRQRRLPAFARRDLILARGEHEHVAFELEQLGVRDRARAGEALERAVLADVLVQRRDVEAVRRRGRRRTRPRRRSTVAPLLGELGRGDAADVAEALDDAAQRGELPAEPRARALDHHHDAGAGRLVPEDRAADRDRLAGHDLRHGVALLHRVGVHHPGHRLLVRRHVGRGDVDLRADERREVGREPARDPRELGAARARAGCSARRPSRRRTGSRSSAHFQVIHIASAAHSPRLTCGVVANAALRRPEHATSAARGRPGTTGRVPSSSSTGSVRITARSG